MNDKIYEKKMELCEAMLEEAIARNQMHYLFGNIGRYSIFAMDSNRNRTHDTSAVLQTLYNYHRKNPQAQIPKLFDETMVRIAQNSGDVEGINNALKILEAQLTAQRENTAAFEVDCDKYIELFKQTAEKFRHWIETGHVKRPGMMEMFQEHSSIMSK